MCGIPWEGVVGLVPVGSQSSDLCEELENAYCISRPCTAGRAASTWMEGLTVKRILTIRRIHLN